MGTTRIAILLAALSLTACASAPSPQPLPTPIAVSRPVPTFLPEHPVVERLCGPAALQISFRSLGVPLHSRVLDLALSEKSVWVLFDPPRLVEVARDSANPTARMWEGRKDAAWGAVDVDPTDGSLWVVSGKRLELIHVDADGQGRIVPLSRVEGSGGFRDVLVDSSGIFVVPTCAADALWRVSREGSVEERSFPRENDPLFGLGVDDPLPTGQDRLEGCIPVSLARDLAGSVTAFDGTTRRFSRRIAREGWREILETGGEGKKLEAGGVLVRSPGREDELWFLHGRSPQYFFLPEGPVIFSAGHAKEGSAHRREIQYLRAIEQGAVTEVEPCDRFATLIDVVADRLGFAAITWEELVLGRLAAP